uniref:Uncharacterized protein n=1 Tax=Anopheles merus TaxID=30066 RepID=A0A182V5Q1_ANOME
MCLVTLIRDEIAATGQRRDRAANGRNRIDPIPAAPARTVVVMMVVMPVRVLWWACLHLRPVAGGRIAGTAAGSSQTGQIRTGRTVQPVLVPAVDAFPRQAKVFVSLRVSHRWLLLPTVVPMVLLLVRMGMVVAGVMVLTRFLHRIRSPFFCVSSPLYTLPKAPSPSSSTNRTSCSVYCGTREIPLLRD